MGKIFMFGAILSLMSLSLGATAQTTDTTAAIPTVPTEIGTTTMPPGQYSLTDQSTGKNYSLMVTTKGTMIFGPAATSAVGTPTTTASPTPSTGGIKGMAESQMQKGMTNLIEKQGMGEIKKFIK